FVAVELVVRAVHDGRDPADDIAAAPREEQRDFSVIVEGMPARGVERLAQVREQRRHPHRVVRVDPPRQLQEPLEIRPPRYLPYFYSHRRLTLTLTLSLRLPPSACRSSRTRRARSRCARRCASP